MTMKQACNMAIDCQNACNGGAIMRRMSDVADAVQEHGNLAHKGTDWRNRHPVTFLFTYKLLDLGNSETSDLFSKYLWAENECTRIIREIESSSDGIFVDYVPYEIYKLGCN